MFKTFLATCILAGTTSGAQAGTTESFTRLAIDTAIDIPASPEVIWGVLADTGRYPEWNPYHVRVEGRMEIGAKLAVHVEKPNGDAVTVHPHLLEAVPGRSLVWGGGPRGIFRGEHRFDLERVSPNCTRVHHTEVFSGLFISFADLDAIEPGYVLMNEALRARVAALSGTGSAC